MRSHNWLINSYIINEFEKCGVLHGIAGMPPISHLTFYLGYQNERKFLSKHQYMLEEHNAVTFVIQVGV